MEKMIPVAIPKYIENLNLPDPELLMLYENYEKRTIWLDTEVDECWLEYGRMILKWNAEDKGLPENERVPIKLFFFTPGGDLDVNNAFIDIIRLSKTKIIGVNVNTCMSAGAFIYLACHERYAFPRSKFLLHSGGADNISGTAQQIQAYNDQYKKEIKQLKDYLIDDCHLPKKLVDSKMKGEWFFDAKEGIELGIVHKIVESLDEVV